MNTVKDIKTELNKTLAGLKSDTSSVETIVKEKVEQEKNRRTEILRKAFKTFDSLSTRVDEIKPDQKGLNADGKVTSETYSAGQFKRLEEARKALNEFEAVLNEVLAKDGGTPENYNKLSEALSKQGVY